MYLFVTEQIEEFEIKCDVVLRIVFWSVFRVSFHHLIVTY